jgi:hypothetical protein
MVFPERSVNSPHYLSLAKIRSAIRSRQVRGFISEGFGTVEAVRRETRAKFHAQNAPQVEVTNKSHGHGLNCMTIEIKANHSLPPGIGEEFEEELNEALAIGIKLLTTPSIGLPVPDRLRNNPHIYSEEVFATDHLDLATKEMLVDALKDFEGTMIFVSHDRMFLRGLGSCVLELGAESGTNRHPTVYPGSYVEYLQKLGHESSLQAETIWQKMIHEPNIYGV